MKTIETKLKDCFVFQPRVVGDERGYFLEGYNQRTFEEVTGKPIHFVQDNQSFSTQGVLRGLHAQKGGFAQAKLVRVLQGEVLDVAVDMRPDSPTFGQHITVHLSSENKKQLFVPRGFLHGFVVLSRTAEFFYKCDNYYYPKQEWGIHFSDPTLNIEWSVPLDQLTVSEKDQILPSFEEAIKAIS